MNTLEFEVVSKSKSLKPSDSTATYDIKEELIVKDMGGKYYSYTRFKRAGQIDCAKDYIYRGRVKPNIKKESHPEYHDMIEDVVFIGVWHGEPILNKDKIPVDPPEDMPVDREATILAQSDLHTAAPMAAELAIKAWASHDNVDEIYMIQLLHFSRLARRAREQLTDEYVAENERKRDGEQ